MKEILGKHAFFGVVFLLFSLPLIQSFTHILPPGKKLVGVEVLKEAPAFTWENLWNGRYQTLLEKWYARTFGLRAQLVRLNNRIYYSVFRQTPPNSHMDIGREGQLFEKGYIQHYLNIDPDLDLPTLETRVKNMSRLARYLAKDGAHFVVMITPSKAALYPHYIPRYYHPEKRKRSENYRQFVALLRQYQVPFVDGPAILRQAQKEYPGLNFFPKGGIHWNSLGVFLITKAFVDHVRNALAKSAPGIEYASLQKTTNLEGGAMELAELLNVARLRWNVAEPRLELKPTSWPETERIRVLINGGSFNWFFISRLNYLKIAKEVDFFYYYSKHYRYAGGQTRELGKITAPDWRNLLRKDVVVLEINESIIKQVAKGFVDDVLRYYESRQTSPAI